MGLTVKLLLMIVAVSVTSAIRTESSVDAKSTSKTLHTLADNSKTALPTTSHARTSNIIKYKEEEDAVSLQKSQEKQSIADNIIINASASLLPTISQTQEASALLEKSREKQALPNLTTISMEKQGSMADKIVLAARTSLALIDSFKEGFVSSLLNKTWEEAEEWCNRACLNETYLPVPPMEIPYTPLDLHYELTRSYAMMQHCLVSLENLNLDQVLHNSVINYCANVSEVIDHISQCLNDLKVYMDSENCSADGKETVELTKTIYTNVGPFDRDLRDFVILRDVRASLQNICETFNHF